MRGGMDGDGGELDREERTDGQQGAHADVAQPRVPATAMDQPETRRLSMASTVFTKYTSNLASSAFVSPESRVIFYLGTGTSPLNLNIMHIRLYRRHIMR